MNDNFLSLNINKTYSNLHTNISKSLICPLLELAISYDRSVGFFSSSWLKQVTKGLATFAKNNRKARIVTSVKLSIRDWQAIQVNKSEAAIQEFIDAIVLDSIQEMQSAMEEYTLGALSWMLQNQIINLRFAVPIGPLMGGIFHTKLALFYDKDGNGVAILGGCSSFSSVILKQPANMTPSCFQGV